MSHLDNQLHSLGVTSLLQGDQGRGHSQIWYHPDARYFNCHLPLNGAPLGKLACFPGLSQAVSMGQGPKDGPRERDETPPCVPRSIRATPHPLLVSPLTAPTAAAWSEPSF